MPTIFDSQTPTSIVSKNSPTGLSRLGDLLARPSRSVEALLARGPGAAVQTLQHSETPEQQQSDRDMLKMRVGLKALIDRLPSAGRGVADAGIDTLLDPTTYLGGLGLIGKGVKYASPALAALAARGATKTALSRAAYDAATYAGEATRGIYNALPAAKAQRLLNKLELVKRREGNLERMGQAAAPHAGQQTELDLGLTRPVAEGAARRKEANALAQRFLRDETSLSKDEKKAVAASVGRYFVGAPRRPSTELAKALSGGESPLQKIVELTNMPMFMLPFRHMANITGLGVLRDPSATASALARKLGETVSPALKASNADIIKHAQEAGQIGFAPERALKGSANIIGAVEKHAPQLKPALDKLGQLGTKQYKWSQGMLWGYDDLVRALAIKNAMKRGATEAEAAHEVNRGLVDYGLRSPLTEGMYAVAPFATFRTGIPGAVLRSLAQHPERGAIADRLTGGTFTGGKGGEGNGVDEFYQPPADVGRSVLGDPASYIRGTLSWPVQDVLSLSGDISARGFQHDPAQAKAARDFGRYFTYGKSVLPYKDKTGKLHPGLFPLQALRVPGASEIPGLNPFKAKGLLRDLLLQQLGIGAQ